MYAYRTKKNSVSNLYFLSNTDILSILYFTILYIIEFYYCLDVNGKFMNAINLDEYGTDYHI
jgi:hypothetical protein